MSRLSLAPPPGYTPCTAPVCFLLPWHGHALCTYLLSLAGSIAACSLSPSSISPCSANDESTGQFCSRKAGKQEGIGIHINKRQPETQRRCNLTLNPSVFLKETTLSQTSSKSSLCILYNPEPLLTPLVFLICPTLLTL